MGGKTIKWLIPPRVLPRILSPSLIRADSYVGLLPLETPSEPPMRAALETDRNIVVTTDHSGETNVPFFALLTTASEGEP